MAHIFISYAHEDRQFVEGLTQVLENHGRLTWHDHRIQTSKYWFRELTKAIIDSYAMIVVMSSHAEQSEFVQKEILLAEKYKIPIYPLLLEGTGLDYLIDKQYYEVKAGKAPGEKLFQDLPDSPVRLESINADNIVLDEEPEGEIDYYKYVSGKVVKYDDASWHYGGDYPKGVPDEQGFVHIGMYLGWLIDRNLVSKEFQKDFQAEIVGFRNRIISGTHITKVMDGKLISDDLSAEGNAFSEYYYNEYLDDFGRLCCTNLSYELRTR